jgi:cellulose synthase/poly-beta-1,6-N-acetylglucosamine synthase-like glycosyltransferase
VAALSRPRHGEQNVKSAAQPRRKCSLFGALALDYPNYRLWVCDDGRRAWLKDLCDQHGCGYITRSDNAHAKAGNINNSILDADFVPKSTFLTRTMALMRESDVGIVQTPQHFFNADPIQTNLSMENVWPDEQRYFCGHAVEGRVGLRVFVAAPHPSSASSR